MKQKNLKNLFKGGKAKTYSLMLLAFVTLNNSVFAGNADMVWEKPTELIQESISGPMAKFISIVVIVVSALGWAFTDGGSFLGKGVKIVCALAIAGGATTLLTGLYGGYTGGLIFG